MEITCCQPIGLIGRVKTDPAFADISVSRQLRGEPVPTQVPMLAAFPGNDCRKAGMHRAGRCGASQDMRRPAGLDFVSAPARNSSLKQP